jgi:single-stranded-DNA-specific exonuclease
VNPLRGEHGEAFKNLAAVGVAAKVMHAMALARPGDVIRKVYRDALQLVALGTIADVVPLTGENRILVAHGVRGLAASEWAGVKALKAVAGLNRGKVTSTDVAFFVAPRLNAAGRMGEARDALTLLLADDPVQAFRLAEHLEAQNEKRKHAERGVLEDALSQLETDGESPPAIVLWSDDWPVGVIGIVAGRLQERLHRPVFLIAMDGETGRGSARSRATFPLPGALSACAELLAEHGGHAAAAGFGIQRKNLSPFRERVERLAGEAELDSTPVPLDVDAAVDLDEVGPECVTWLERLSPFGRGNPEPLLGCEGMVLNDIPTVVGKRHLRMSFNRGSGSVRAIAFNQGERVRELDRGQKVDAVFHASFDTWRGGRNVQLVVRDLRIR